LPVWSPDGRHTLITLSADLQQDDPQDPPVVWLADAAAKNKQAVGVGQRPFWLDAQTYGYLRVNAAGQEEWVTAVIDDPTPHPLLSEETLLAALPEAQRPEALFMNAPTPLADRPGQLVMRAFTSNDSEQTSYLFAVTRTPDQDTVEKVTLLYQSDSSSWFELSPDGRWLVTYNDNSGFAGYTIILQNLETGTQYPLSSTIGYSSDLSWSPDGKWTVRNGDGFILLGVPDAHYEQVVFHDFDDCNDTAWQEIP
jgi:hypothetical protein